MDEEPARSRRPDAVDASEDLDVPGPATRILGTAAYLREARALSATPLPGDTAVGPAPGPAAPSTRPGILRVFPVPPDTAPVSYP
ncbi:hypothetical protein [Streptomyces cucumeris]|uniref:hypothetical protein n=1 Tax=Streptomyces cucumeris TaxID=2962890 RepID=UPI003D71A7DD